MKKVVCVLLTLAMVVGVVACAAPAAQPAAAPAAQPEAAAPVVQPAAPLVEEATPVDDMSKYQFAIVYGGVHPFFDPWEPGAKRAAQDLGIPEPYIVSPQAWDQTEQNQVLDGVLAKGAKGIGMFPSDAVAGNEQITKMVSAGIPVVTMGGSPAEPSDASFCYATDVGASVAYGTQAVIDKLKANGKTSGNIVHLCSSLADTNTQKRQKAINEVLAKPENAGFVLYQELADTDATEPAEKAISSMYASYIDDVDGIICTGYVNAQVLAKTMMERDEHRVVAVGIDDSQDVLDAIQQKTGIMPLVLHGGTGIPSDMIKKAIDLGVSKINVNTECQLSFADATRKYIEAGKDLEGKGFDPRKLLAPGAEAIKATVKEKMELFGSVGKA